VHHLGILLSVAQSNINDGLDPQNAENLIVGLMVVSVMALVFVVRTIQKVTTRVVLSLLLIGIVGGLWLQRDNLEDCRGQCSCRLFGQDIRTDPGTFCPGEL